MHNKSIFYFGIVFEQFVIVWVLRLLVPQLRAAVF